jgi:hypothetical protein
MNDHVARMVYAWFARAQEAEEPAQVLSDLVSAIHRMLREAESEIRQRCEELAVEVAGEEHGGKVALAIRTDLAESLPRKSLTGIEAPDLTRQ